MERRHKRSNGQLYGRVILRGRIRCLTGLHIGSRGSSPAVGGIDQAAVRDPLTYRPYIPGSALRGKLRSLCERAEGLPPNWDLGGVHIHVCTRRPACAVCRLFGVPSQVEAAGSTRLIVRDTFLDEASIERLAHLRTDLPFTEVKGEAAVDRITAAAVPREVERVPAGAVFAGMEFIFSIYAPDDADDFALVARSLALLEDDYLGGGGSRGAGQVRFEELTVLARTLDSYGLSQSNDKLPQLVLGSASDLLARSEEVVAFIREHILSGTAAPAAEEAPPPEAPASAEETLVAEPPPATEALPADQTAATEEAPIPEPPPTVPPPDAPAQSATDSAQTEEQPAGADAGDESVERDGDAAR